MKRIATCLVLSTLACMASAEPVTYTFEPTHTNVTWEVVHFGTSTTRGRFERVEGQVVLDRKEHKGSVSLQIDMRSINTTVPVFTATLKKNDFFDIDDFPSAFFVAERMDFDGDKVKSVRGEFTMKGVSQPLTLTATRFDCYFNPLFKREVCGGDFETKVLRSTYGITNSLPLVADEVTLRIQVEAIKQ